MTRPTYRHLVELHGVNVYLLPTGDLALERADGAPVTDADELAAVAYTEAHPELFRAECPRCEGLGVVEVIHCTKADWHECCGGCTKDIACKACHGEGEADLRVSA